MKNHNYHVSTGIFGSRYIYWVLGKYGYDKTVKKVLHSNTFPSYGYLFSLGATTFWEHWGEKEFTDRPEASGDERSKNHPFQPGFDAWFYNGIAGINPDPEHPGFKHIIFKPQLTKILDYAGAGYYSMHGLIASKWKNADDIFEWLVTVPVNTTATIYIPASSSNQVFENNSPICFSETISILRKEERFIVLEVGSGEYSFTVNKN